MTFLPFMNAHRISWRVLTKAHFSAASFSSRTVCEVHKKWSVGGKPTSAWQTDVGTHLWDQTLLPRSMDVLCLQMGIQRECTDWSCMCGQLTQACNPVIKTGEECADLSAHSPFGMTCCHRLPCGELTSRQGSQWNTTVLPLLFPYLLVRTGEETATVSQQQDGSSIWG